MGVAVDNKLHSPGHADYDGLSVICFVASCCKLFRPTLNTHTMAHKSIKRVCDININ